MEKIVVITNECKLFLDKVNEQTWNIREVNNIADYFSNDKNLDLVGPLLLVICCTYEEYCTIKSVIALSIPQQISYTFILYGNEKIIEKIHVDEIHLIGGFYTNKVNPHEYLFAINKMFYEMSLNRQMADDWEKVHTRLIDSYQDQEDLVNIGKLLSVEKDQDTLLRMILELSKKITGADAGSIYLVEKDNNKKKILRFKYSKTFSRDVPLEEFTLVINKKSIAGYVATTGEVLNIEDVYNIPNDAPYSFNANIDKQNNYRSKSMLVVPMKNHLDEIIGVIQLLNSKENLEQKLRTGQEAVSIRLTKPGDFDQYVTTFDQKYNNILEAIAGQAAIAIENNRLIRQIENQFEQFVKASVTAIESRDPATSGHSFRVADMCKAMLYAINQETDGTFRKMFFNKNEIREMELAALLHDFGKVYIDISLFGKKKKLYPEELQSLLLRIELLYRYIELTYTNKAYSIMNSNDDKKSISNVISEINTEKDEKLKQISNIKKQILLLNEPTVNENHTKEKINQIIDFFNQYQVINSDGEAVQILTEEDIVNLAIERGSLNETERKKMQSHVDHTYAFVSKIPWPDEYRNIPEIALHHHEKLDGTGYPDRLIGKQSTSIQSRIMAIVDIYDALTSGDRQYKKAVSVKKSLEMLKNEADSGHIDEDLVDLFIRYNIFDQEKRNAILHRDF